MRIPIKDRFVSKFVRGKDEECWNWLGHVNRYGRIWDADLGMSKLAHRFSYEVFIGPIPEGMEVCHTCDNGACVNPAHFFLGTQQDNMTDKVRKGRVSRTRLHGEACKHNTLTEGDVIYVRESKETIRKLAQKYNVSQSTIWRARKRKTFTNI